MSFISLRSLLKPLLFWSVVILISCEVLLHYKLKDLPYKFLNHTTGLIHKLGQYSKKEVIPKNYLAIIGDSNVYGYGPWLYDNSWSMEQPSFAPHHLLHSALNQDIVSFGYPGYGSFGSTIHMVGELKTLQSSWMWSKIENPQEILFVFYEGNDLINNLHEVQQRGLDLNASLDLHITKKLKKVFTKAEIKLSEETSWTDHLASWNLFSGLTKNYCKKFFPEKRKLLDSDLDPSEKGMGSLNKTQNSVSNLAIINGKERELGFSEGPALLLSDEEINLSLKITEHSLSYLKSNFPNSRISVVYLPSSLSIYSFADCELSPAPLDIWGGKRNGLFKPIDAKEKNLLIRENLSKITISLGFEFIDCTEYLQQQSISHLLHGPRDPIHLNRLGYESFANAIYSYLNSRS